MFDTLTGLGCKVYIRTLLNEHSVLSSASRKFALRRSFRKRQQAAPAAVLVGLQAWASPTIN